MFLKINGKLSKEILLTMVKILFHRNQNLPKSKNEIFNKFLKVSFKIHFKETLITQISLP